ncbi:hypothetical protein Smp_124160.1 [Schistosoma mansoni]|uniref:hypothetical protein n=1 Tax=Schistosoma mansoni TaxID=6183 RepID=UPI0001A63F8A|nr:hypothetical protein Smp_124160.1 [Schistosoma mansoni]|eukprot:XP_018647651.1 hypothetical protein Smp_124160.1 [Schistosoma mansoni]
MTTDNSGKSHNSLLSNVKFDPIELEDRYVHQVYDVIASEFSSTRHSPWPSVLKFIEAQPLNSLGADVGCGNGKYLTASSKYYATMKASTSSTSVQCKSIVATSNFIPIAAMERSPKLAEIVYNRAVIHHLSTMARRIEAVNELARILRVGGQGLIQVWAKEQHGISKSEPSYYVNRKTKTMCNVDDSPESLSKIVEAVPGTYLHLHVNGTEFQNTDMLVPWKKKTHKVTDQLKESNQPLPNSMYGRYYHLFVMGELDDLISKVPVLKIDKSFYEQGNWVVHVTKIV